MYHVLFGPNDVRQMTLDQVDDCFRLGVITEETMLWTDGMKGWETLKEAAGLGGSESGASSKAPPPPRRRSSRAEPPPRRRGPSRAASSPEVVTSARPLQESQPARGAARAVVSHAAVSHAAVSHAAVSHAAVSHAAVSHGGSAQVAVLHAGGSHEAAAQQAYYGASSNPFLQTTPSAGVQPTALRPAAAPIVREQQPYLGQVAAHMAPVAPIAPVNAPAPAARHGVAQSEVHSAGVGWPTAPASAALAPRWGQPQASQEHLQAQHLQTSQLQWPQAQSPQLRSPQVHAQFHAARPSQSPFPQPPFSQPAALSQAPHSLAPMAVTASAWPASDDLDDVPFGRRARGGGARAQGWLLTLCVLAGVSVVAYRNDYLFQLAKSFRQESAYLALERRYLGGAPDGTPRDVEQLVEGIAPAIQTVVFGRDNPRVDSEALDTRSGGSALGSTTQAASRGSEGAGAVTAADTARLGGSETGANAASAPQALANEPAARPQAPVADAPIANTAEAEPAKLAARALGSTSGTRASNPTARLTEPKREAARRSFADSSIEEDKPSRSARERVAKSEREAQPEPMPAAGTDDFLHMSMRQAIKKKSGSGATASTSEPPKKKKSSRADYDPLNGEI